MDSHLPAWTATCTTRLWHDEQRRELRALHDAISAALDSSQPPDMRPFVSPRLFADTADFIKSQLGFAASGAAKALHGGGPCVVQRVAQSFFVFPAGWPEREIFTLEDLRRVAENAPTTRKGRGLVRTDARTRAKLALAFLGATEWNEATRPERAALMYGDLIREARR